MERTGNRKRCEQQHGGGQRTGGLFINGNERCERMCGSNACDGEYNAEYQHADDNGIVTDGESDMRIDEYDTIGNGGAGWEYVHVDEQRGNVFKRSERQHGKCWDGDDIHFVKYASGIGMYECVGIYGDTGRKYAYGESEQQQRDADV